MRFTAMGRTWIKSGTKTSAFAVLGGAVVVFSVAALYAFRTVGPGDLGSEHAEVAIVFGSPADISGALTPMQRWRVEEGVAEYRRGRAPVLLFTGGAAANKFVESQVMAQYANALGVPSRDILTETRSKTTIENIRNSTPLLQSHGWTRVELISSQDHLPRIAVLMRGKSFVWRLHAAPTPGRSFLSAGLATLEEALATLLLRSFGSAAEPVIHVVAVCVHWIVFIPKYLVYKVHTLLRSA